MGGGGSPTTVRLRCGSWRTHRRWKTGSLTVRREKEGELSVSHICTYDTTAFEVVFVFV